MITLEKFFKTLKVLNPQGRWLMGLIICETNPAIDDDFEYEIITVSDTLDCMELAKKIHAAFANQKWVILDVKNKFSSDIYSQLKRLSGENRLYISDSEIIKQPDSSRIIVKATREVIKLTETDYPDFKRLFGPVISI